MNFSVSLPMLHMRLLLATIALLVVGCHNDLQKRLPIVFLSQKDENALFLSKQDGWKTFYKIHPKSPGIITLSRVGFTRAGDMAMFHFGSQSHWLAGGGRIHIFRKEDGKWVELRKIIGDEWAS